MPVPHTIRSDVVGSGDLNFSLSSNRLDSASAVGVKGELDMYSAPVLEDFIEGLVVGGERTIVIDLTGATFIESVGLRVLVQGAKLLRSLGGTLAVACDDGNVRRVLEITGIGLHVPTYESLEEAVADVNAARELIPPA
jgi:anti-sigma B factor antagonist